MIILTKDEILFLHDKLIQKTGGLHGVRDMGLLESAVANCMQTFDEQELYPTIIEKAAVTAFSICKNHPFADGNKRIAILSMLMMLRLNKVELSYAQQELIDLGLGIANGNIDYDGIVDWLNNHCIK